MKIYNLTRDQVDTLARFNAERSRGIVHTPEWASKMATYQRRFDQQYAGVRETNQEEGRTA